MKNIEKEAVKILEIHTSDMLKDIASCFKEYKGWILSLNAEELKGAIIGCAVFKYNNSRVKVLSSNKIEKNKARYNIKIAKIYLNFAKDVFYTYREYKES